MDQENLLQKIGFVYADRAKKLSLDQITVTDLVESEDKAELIARHNYKISYYAVRQQLFNQAELIVDYSEWILLTPEDLQITLDVVTNLSKLIVSGNYDQFVNDKYNSLFAELLIAVKLHLEQVCKVDCNSDGLFALVAKVDALDKYRVNLLNYCSAWFTFFYQHRPVEAKRWLYTIANDYVLVELGSEVVVLPAIMLDLFLDLYEIFNWFSNYFSWFISICSFANLDWELISLSYQVKQLCLADSGVDQWDKYIRLYTLINNKINNLQVEYNKLWPVISYFKRVFLEAYIAYYQTQLEALLEGIEVIFINQIKADLSCINVLEQSNSILVCYKLYNLLLEQNITVIGWQQLQHKYDVWLLKAWVDAVFAAGAQAEQHRFALQQLTYTHVTGVSKIINRLYGLNDYNLMRAEISALIEVYQRYYYVEDSSVYINQLIQSLGFKSKSGIVVVDNISRENYFDQLVLNSQAVACDRQLQVNNWLSYSYEFAKTTYLGLDPDQFDNILDLYQMFKSSRIDLLVGLANAVLNKWQSSIVVSISNLTLNQIQVGEFLADNIDNELWAPCKSALAVKIKQVVLKSNWSLKLEHLLRLLGADYYHLYNFQGLQFFLHNDVGLAADFFKVDLLVLLGVGNNSVQVINRIIHRAMIGYFNNNRVLNMRFLKTLSDNDIFTCFYLRQTQADLDKMRLALELETCLNSIKELTMNTNFVDWFARIIIILNNIKLVDNILLENFKDRIFFACSNCWQEFVMEDNLFYVVERLTLLKESILLPLSDYHDEFSILFNLWLNVCANNYRVLSAGDNILNLIRFGDFDKLLADRFYFTVLQLKLYSKQVYIGIRVHLLWLQQQEGVNYELVARILNLLSAYEVFILNVNLKNFLHCSKQQLLLTSQHDQLLITNSCQL